MNKSCLSCSQVVVLGGMQHEFTDVNGAVVAGFFFVMKEQSGNRLIMIKWDVEVQLHEFIYIPCVINCRWWISEIQLTVKRFVRHKNTLSDLLYYRFLSIWWPVSARFSSFFSMRATPFTSLNWMWIPCIAIYYLYVHHNQLML